MTADNNNTSESDNSDSRTTESPSKQRSALPLIAVLQDSNGWALKTDLYSLIGPSSAEIDEYVDLLVRTDELHTADLGERTLVMLRQVDVHDAVAALSDHKEQQWRQMNGDELPQIDERTLDNR